MANNKNMDALLKWSIAQQGADDAAAAANGQPSMAAVASDIAAGRRPDLADPGLFDAIMGKSEATMMREELGAALDEKRTEQDRVTALDNFEMVSAARWRSVAEEDEGFCGDGGRAEGCCTCATRGDLRFRRSLCG
jgi:hypothetical protein